jgi:transposase
VAILNPPTVRRFAQSMGRLEKADSIDAGMIAWYAKVKESTPLSLATTTQQHLRALVARLRQLTEIRTTQLNQQRLIMDAAMLAPFDELPAVVARQGQRTGNRHRCHDPGRSAVAIPDGDVVFGFYITRI